MPVSGNGDEEMSVVGTIDVWVSRLAISISDYTHLISNEHNDVINLSPSSIIN